MHERKSALTHWLETSLNLPTFTSQALAGDAGFRQYYRIKCPGKLSYIAMDSPPDKEPLDSFLKVSALLQRHHIYIPTIHAADIKRGFLLIEDFGDTLLLSALTTQNADQLYTAALSLIQNIQQIPFDSLPAFNIQYMSRELELFQTWFLQALLGLPLSPKESQLFEQTFAWLMETVEAQPKVLIHRDYHSRNLMLLPSENSTTTLGLIDFQDAMQGPITYDLVSLLKDCYIRWPDERIKYWLMTFYQTCSDKFSSFDQFTRAFDLCGLQRHLKVLGIFSRLHLRDNKSDYLRSLPRTLDYVMSVLPRYPELQPFYQFMSRIVKPLFNEKQLS